MNKQKLIKNIKKSKKTKNTKKIIQNKIKKQKILIFHYLN